MSDTSPAFTLRLKRGDRLPPLELTLSRGSGDALGFAGTDVAGVRVFLKHTRTGVLKVDAAATTAVVAGDGLSMAVTYQWADDDTDTAGIYDCEVEVTLADGRRLTFPNDGHGRVYIEADLGDAP